jgi:hypothetical protein
VQLGSPGQTLLVNGCHTCQWTSTHSHKQLPNLIVRAIERKKYYNLVQAPLAGGKKMTDSQDITGSFLNIIKRPQSQYKDIAF